MANLRVQTVRVLPTEGAEFLDSPEGLDFPDRFPLSKKRILFSRNWEIAEGVAENLAREWPHSANEERAGLGRPARFSLLRLSGDDLRFDPRRVKPVGGDDPGSNQNLHVRNHGPEHRFVGCAQRQRRSRRRSRNGDEFVG